MAAVAMAYAYGVPVDVIRKTLMEFAGVEHRIEFVAEKTALPIIMIPRGLIPMRRSGAFRR